MYPEAISDILFWNTQLTDYLFLGGPLKLSPSRLPAFTSRCRVHCWRNIHCFQTSMQNSFVIQISESILKKKKTAVFDRFMFIKWLLCYAKYCFSWLVYVGNTISNWLFLIPPFFGAILSWQYKLERRYTFAFISLCGKLCHACFWHVVMVMCQYPFILLWTFSML